MGLLLEKLASPRVQVPLATTASLTAVAQILLNVLDLRELSPGAAGFGLALVVPAAYLVAWRLFVASDRPQQAYLLGASAPIVIAIVVGHVVLGGARGEWLPDTIYISFIGGFSVGPLTVAIASAPVGLVGSALLVLEVSAATSAIRADPRRGAHQFTAVAWAMSFGMASLAFSLGEGFERVVAGTLASAAVAALALQWLDRRRLLERAAPAVGPYRTAMRI
jgi:hypothetical protein